MTHDLVSDNPKSNLYAHRMGVKARLLLNRDAILKVLTSAGAVKAEVDYCGSGDSGAVEGVRIFDGNEQEIHPEGDVEVLHAQGSWSSKENAWVDHLKVNTCKLCEAIEELVYDWLEFEHAGWENNDGASGTCTINVAEASLILGHYTYYTQSDYSEHIL